MGGVLSHQSILARCPLSPGGAPSLVVPFEPAQVRTAAYDLRMGLEYYVDDPPELPSTTVGVRRLDPDHLTLQIHANQVVVVRTLENVAMPDDLVGHLSLKLGVMLKGLIMSSQSQIDAGYEGPIFALLYNLSDQAVTLRHGQSLLRLEFAELDEPTVKPYDGDVRPHWVLADAVEGRLTSSLEGISRVARTALDRVTQLGIAGVITLVVTLVFGVGAILYDLLGPVQRQVSDAESTSKAANVAVDDLEGDVGDLQRRLAELQGEIAQMQRQATTTTVARR